MRFSRRAARRSIPSAVLLLLLLAAPAAGRPAVGPAVGPGPGPVGERAEPCRIRLLTSVDRRAVEVGGIVQLGVEVLAAPCNAGAERAAAEALGTFDLARQLGAGFEVVRVGRVLVRRTGRVVELQRRFVVRVTSAAVDALPALRLAVRIDGLEVADGVRPQPLRAYRLTPAAHAAAAQVVAVTVDGAAAGQRFRRIGSAFLLGGDALVTAYHVVANGRRVAVHLPDGRTVRTSRAWVLDPARDVAVLHLDAETARTSRLEPLTLAVADAASRESMTAGFPGGTQQVTVAARYDDLALDGHRLRITSNTVRPGDSGGPLLDPAGRVLGVVVSGRATGDDADLLREDVCLATDPTPALARYRTLRARGGRPTRLRTALAAARALPSARVLEAADALRQPEPSGGAGAYVAAVVDAARRAPGDPVLQFLAGSVLEQAGAAVPARGAFEEAWDAGYVPAAYALGYSHLRRGDPAEAAGFFESVRRTPAYARLGTFGLAQSLVARGRLAEADALLDEVVDHDGLFAPALYLLGLARLADGREADAEALQVRLGRRPEWAAALRLAVEAPALRPAGIERLPRYERRGTPAAY